MHHHIKKLFEKPKNVRWHFCIRLTNGLKGTRAGKIDGSNIFILAPFMIKSLINAKTNDPLKLIPIVIDAAKNFDDEISGESQLASEHA